MSVRMGQDASTAGGSGIPGTRAESARITGRTEHHRPESGSAASSATVLPTTRAEFSAATA